MKKTEIIAFIIVVLGGMFIFYQLYKQKKEVIQPHAIESKAIQNLEVKKAVEAVKTESLKKGIEKLKRKSKILKHKSDSVVSLVSDTNCIKVIGYKQAEIDTLTSTIALCDSTVTSIEKRLYMTEKQSEIKDTIIVNKNNTIRDLNIKCKRNFIEKYGVLIGLVIGEITYILISK